MKEWRKVIKFQSNQIKRKKEGKKEGKKERKKLSKEDNKKKNENFSKQTNKPREKIYGSSRVKRKDGKRKIDRRKKKVLRSEWLR